MLACKLDTLIGVNVKTNECLAGLSSAYHPTSLETIRSELQTPKREGGVPTEREEDLYSVDRLQNKAPQLSKACNIRRWESFKVDPLKDERFSLKFQEKDNKLLKKHSEINTLGLSVISEGSILTDAAFEKYVRTVVGSLCSESTEAMYNDCREKRL